MDAKNTEITLRGVERRVGAIGMNMEARVKASNINKWFQSSQPYHLYMSHLSLSPVNTF